MAGSPAIRAVARTRWLFFTRRAFMPLALTFTRTVWRLPALMLKLLAPKVTLERLRDFLLSRTLPEERSVSRPLQAVSRRQVTLTLAVRFLIFTLPARIEAARTPSHPLISRYGFTAIVLPLCEVKRWSNAR